MASTWPDRTEVIDRHASRDLLQFLTPSGAGSTLNPAPRLRVLVSAALEAIQSLAATAVPAGSGTVARTAPETLALALALTLAPAVAFLLPLSRARAVATVRAVLALANLAGRISRAALAPAGTLLSRDGER